MNTSAQEAPVVPVIDIAPFFGGAPADRKKVADQVGRACERIGFFTIVGHGVPRELVNRMDEVSRAFFSLPIEEKRRAKGANPGKGYTGVGDEGLAYSLGQKAPVDLKEALAIGRVDTDDDPYFQRPEAEFFFTPNVWPTRPPELRAIWTEYFQVMDRLAADLMRIFALALDLPERHFDPTIDKAINKMRAILYPAQKDAPGEGQLRAGAHSDYGSLTILRAEAVPGGLEVKTRDGQWAQVGPAEGAFVINIGDLMQFWTNDRWVSTLHRVGNPPRSATLYDRLSLVFFQQPNYDALIECLPGCAGPGNPARYAPVTSGEHYRSKFLSTRVAAQM